LVLDDVVELLFVLLALLLALPTGLGFDVFFNVVDEANGSVSQLTNDAGFAVLMGDPLVVATADDELLDAVDGIVFDIPAIPFC
jgi:hypothetical protein